MWVAGTDAVQGNSVYKSGLDRDGLAIVASTRRVWLWLHAIEAARAPIVRHFHVLDNSANNLARCRLRAPGK